MLQQLLPAELRKAGSTGLFPAVPGFLKSTVSTLAGGVSALSGGMTDQVKEGINDAMKQALGGTSQEVKQTFKGLASGTSTVHPAGFSDPQVEQLFGPIQDKLQSSISQATTSQMSALPRLGMAVSSFFGKSGADLSQVGQAAAQKFTPDCPAVSSFGKEIAETVANPAWTNTVNQNGNFGLKALNSLFSMDFKGLMNQTKEWLGMGSATSQGQGGVGG